MAGRPKRTAKKAARKTENRARRVSKTRVTRPKRGRQR